MTSATRVRYQSSRKQGKALGNCCPVDACELFCSDAAPLLGSGFGYERVLKGCSVRVIRSAVFKEARMPKTRKLAGRAAVDAPIANSILARILALTDAWIAPCQPRTSAKQR